MLTAVLEAKWAYWGRIQFAFTLSLLVSAAALAKSVPNGPPSLLPTTAATRLGYPALPQTILERIQTKSNKPVSYSPRKLDKSLSQSWGLATIGFFEVYTPLVQPLDPSLKPCSNEIVVAVIDTGIDYTHPDLFNNLWINPKESLNGKDNDGDKMVGDVMGWDFVNDQPLAYDVHGHGTHIAGIISGAAGSGAGMVGVCPRVSIMPLKYYDNSGVGYNNLQNTVRAIRYAVEHGAHIINYSGGGADPAPAERAAIEEARNRGILFIAAAGNDGHNNDFIHYYPASYDLDNIISVASVGKDEKFLPSSNWGSKSVHLAAPGLSVYSSLPGGRFGTMSGTSQATAFVTGAAALLASQLPKGQFDYRRIKQWLVQATRPMPGAEKKTVSGGILSIAKALKAEKDDLNKRLVGTEIAQHPKATGVQPASTMR